MKTGQRTWTRDELILAINLYSKIEFGKMHSRNPKIIELARMIGRTPGSVAFKLVNFASLDPNLKKRGIRGASHSANLDREIWNEFYNNWDSAFEESEELLASRKNTSIENLYDLENIVVNEKGVDNKRWVKTRINQHRFRQMVLTNYKATCCITGLQEPQLLIASHITLWSKYENNRLNPANGLCLNSLHDKAFEIGLITISAEDYTILVSSILKKAKNDTVNRYFSLYEGKRIILPQKFLPAQDFLKIHNDQFKG
jgi:putative restriction endonuclease